jgi:hypothetical protein
MIPGIALEARTATPALPLSKKRGVSSSRRVDDDLAPRQLFQAAALDAAVDVVLQLLAVDPAAIGERRRIEQRQRAALHRQRVEFDRVQAAGPEHPEQRTDAAADNQVGVDPRLLEHAQHADVRVAARAAAAEHQRDARRRHDRPRPDPGERRIGGGIVERRAARQAGRRQPEQAEQCGPAPHVRRPVPAHARPAANRIVAPAPAALRRSDSHDSVWKKIA